MVPASTAAVPASAALANALQRPEGVAALTQAYLTVSEVLGHMDLLMADGRVEELDDGALARYRALVS